MHRIVRPIRFAIPLLGALVCVGWSFPLQAQSYQKLSPFSAVRWEEDRPQVQIGATWYELLKINGVDVTTIVEFCDEEYRRSSHMRFEEDLVEVLTSMGHKPDRSGTLTVKEPSTDETIVLKDVQWSNSNRSAIRDRRLEAEDSELRIARGDPKISTDDDQFAATVDEFMNMARRKTGFSGAVIIAQGETVLYSKAFGISNLKSQQPNTLDTPFRIASLSKQFTAAAIVHMQQEGRLQVSDPVSKYLPQFKKPPYDKIQIHHLLSHTSGLPKSATGLRAMTWLELSLRIAKASEYVDLATKTRLSYPTGTEYEYSNFGYRILSAVIESIAQKSFADYMEETVFQPTGMNRSGVARSPTPESESRVAQGLRLRRLAPDEAPNAYRDGQLGRVYASGFGSGGIYASANDLLKWHRVLNGTRLLSDDSKQLLFRPNLDNYAYGWKVKNSAGKLYQSHSGSNEGFFSMMMRVPEDDLVVIVVGNQDKTDELNEAIKEFVRMACGLHYKLP